MATNSNVIDVDAGYDPKCGLTLDEYRQQAFAELKQVPFGAPTKATEPKAE